MFDKNNEDLLKIVTVRQSKASICDLVLTSKANYLI